MSAVHCPALAGIPTPRGLTSERAQYLRQNIGIDAAMLAADLGVTTGNVERLQRKLDLRAFKYTKRVHSRQ